MLMFGVSLARGCECVSSDVQSSQKRAEIVFRGRITGLRDTGDGTHAVIFAVDRVWKGDVPRTFEMPAIRETSMCIGFWTSYLEVGNDLLVYAYRIDGKGDFITDICSRTALAEKSKDFAELGPGHAPKSK
jgi:hypothetical protein